MQIWDHTSNTCLNGSESRGSDPNGGFCFHIVKPVRSILPLLPFLANLWKTRICTLFDVSFMVMLKFRNHSTTLLRRSRLRSDFGLRLLLCHLQDVDVLLLTEIDRGFPIPQWFLFHKHSRLCLTLLHSFHPKFFTLSMKVQYKLFIISEKIFQIMQCV